MPQPAHPAVDQAVLVRDERGSRWCYSTAAAGLSTGSYRAMLPRLGAVFGGTLITSVHRCIGSALRAEDFGASTGEAPWPRPLATNEIVRGPAQSIDPADFCP